LGETTTDRLLEIVIFKAQTLSKVVPQIRIRAALTLVMAAEMAGPQQQALIPRAGVVAALAGTQGTAAMADFLEALLALPDLAAAAVVGLRVFPTLMAAGLAAAAAAAQGF
jgi:hypothetical protein